MGVLDQFIKRVFREETARATRDTITFDNAPEIATASLTPDGILTRVVALVIEAALLAPWTLFTFRFVLDFKMEGDHTDYAAFTRVELRRLAAWVAYLEHDAPEGPDAHPSRYGTLVVAPHLPLWLRDPVASDPLSVTLAALGCYGITPRDHPVVWVAANELPLDLSLVPFLWARSGRARVEFVRWQVFPIRSRLLAPCSMMASMCCTRERERQGLPGRTGLSRFQKHRLSRKHR